MELLSKKTIIFDTNYTNIIEQSRGIGTAKFE